MSYEVIEGERDGFASVILRSPRADLEAEWVPGAGMVGCSLRHRGEELLGQRGGLGGYVERGSSFGIPLLAPWANRLSGLRYEAAGKEVELDPSRTPLKLDGNGLPMHGLLTASPLWSVEEQGAGDGGAFVVAALDFGAREELLAGFPFPHRLVVAARVTDGVLVVDSDLEATGDVPVPVSFGWHPYLTLPGVGREEWEVDMPVRARAVLDERGLPTGRIEEAGRIAGALGSDAYDDLFPDLHPLTTFAVAGGGRRLEVRFGWGYPVAQVYAPPGEPFICFEPMTAPTNALVRGEGLRCVAPGETFTARFAIAVLDA
jgi:galactose mutarotase-like enzyme